MHDKICIMKTSQGTILKSCKWFMHPIPYQWYWNACPIWSMTYWCPIWLYHKYSGLSQGRYGQPHAMGGEEYIELCRMLKGTCLEKLVVEAGPVCPPSHRKVLGELSRGSPTCAVFQLFAPETENTLDILKEAASGISSLSDHAKLFKQTCPLLADFASASDVSDSALREFLGGILASIETPFRQPIPRSGNN